MAGIGTDTRQTRAIAALLSAESIESAAGVAGVGVRTLRRWLAEDTTFVGALREAQSELLSENLRSLLAAMADNRRALIDLRDGAASEAIRLRAAVALDASLRSWWEAAELHNRLVALEAALQGDGDHRVYP